MREVRVMSKDVRESAQTQAEEGFDGFMYWMKKGTIVSVLLLAIVVVGCNSGVEKGSYPAYNGEQYNPSNMSINK